MKCAISESHSQFRTQPVRAIHTFHDDEAGFMTFVNVVAVMLCTLLIALVANVGWVTFQKVEVQNAADATAYSAAVWQARGMNAITATNHVMGEMTAFVILHEAIGGKKQEERRRANQGENKSEEAEDPRRLNRQDRNLERAYRAARAIGGSPTQSIYNMVLQRVGNRARNDSDIFAEATLLDSKMVLKRWLERAYWGLMVAEIMQRSSFPPVVAAGVALEAAMKILELKIAQEYATLKALHMVADQLLPLKRFLRDQMLPFAKQYTVNVKNNTPIIANAVAEEVASQNGATGAVFPQPGRLKLPVVIDPFARANSRLPVNSQVPQQSSPCACPNRSGNLDRDRIVKMTQLARASFPWVNYHRKPILDALRVVATISGARGYYFHWTNGYSKFVNDELQTQRDLGLFVLEGYEAPDKGYELWNIPEYSFMADELFTVIGLAHRGRPSLLGAPSVYHQENPEGTVAYAMAMIYNANEQQRPEHRIDMDCARIVPIRQANVGWDTLNWLPGSRQDSEGCGSATGEPVRGQSQNESRPFELLGIGLPAEYPSIQVNWQAKLVPASGYRLGQLSGASMPGPFESFTRKLMTTGQNVPSSLTTH